MDLEKYKKNYQEIEAFQQTKNLDYYAHPARYYVKPFKIVGNVYYIGDSKVCSHLIDTGDGLIMFDSGFQHSVHLLVQAVWEAGFNPADIKYLIHSHEHFDHIGAADEFRDLYGCKLAISRAGADIMRERPELVYLKACPNPYATLFTPGSGAGGRSGATAGKYQHPLRADAGTFSGCHELFLRHLRGRADLPCGVFRRSRVQHAVPGKAVGG